MSSRNNKSSCTPKRKVRERLQWLLRMDSVFAAYGLQVRPIFTWIVLCADKTGVRKTCIGVQYDHYTFPESDRFGCSVQQNIIGTFLFTRNDYYRTARSSCGTICPWGIHQTLRVSYKIGLVSERFLSFLRYISGIESFFWIIQHFMEHETGMDWPPYYPIVFHTTTFCGAFRKTLNNPATLEKFEGLICEACASTAKGNWIFHSLFAPPPPLCCRRCTFWLDCDANATTSHGMDNLQPISRTLYRGFSVQHLLSTKFLIRFEIAVRFLQISK